MASKKQNIFLLLASVLLFVCFSCQKEINYNDDQTHALKVTSSTVSGFVTNKNAVPVMGASVSIGSSTTTTDQFGFFEVSDVLLVKNTGVVVVTYSGYFNGIKTFIAEENKEAFFRIRLIAKINSGNIAAASGGSITMNNGMVVSLPGGAVVNASTSV
ncbi:MAG: hypothetical protein ABIO04_05775, partial [Ferruginibacter sp.]